MLVPGFSYYVNLGFWYLRLLVILSFPVIGYVVSRKWRFAVAKEAEIRRLMVLAAVEASRAEVEAAEDGYYVADCKPVNKVAAFGHGVEVPVKKGSLGSCGDSLGYSDEVSVQNESTEIALSGVKVYQCAVCLNPTTTRCSRCKAIRYCSAKCQIFHWRDGHKDECHSPSILNQSSDAENYPHSKVFKLEKKETHTGSVETEDRHSKQSRSHREGNAFCSIGRTEQLQGNNHNIKTEKVREVKPSRSTSSFSTSFSSDSSSSSVNSVSSNDTSTTESSGSSELDKTNGCQQADTSNLAKCVPKRASEIKTCDVKGGTTAPSKSNGAQAISSHRDTQRTSNSALSSSFKGSDPLVVKSGASEFWEETLDYRWSEPVKTKSRVTDDGLSNIGSSLRHASGLYGKIEKSSHVDGKTYCSLLVINEHSNESASSKRTDVSSSEVCSPILSSSKPREHSNVADNNALNVTGENKLRSSSSAAVLSHHRGETAADAQKVSKSPLSASKKPDLTQNGTSHISKSRSSSASNGGGTVLSVKGDNICQANGVSHSQNASRSSSIAERLGRAMNYTEVNCTVQSLKSRLTDSNVTKVDAVKSNNIGISNKSYSLKVANGVKTSTWKAVDHFKASKLSRRCGAYEKHENKGLFSYELFKSLYGWNNVELQPYGLVNCGNSCYANVVLQCLSFTLPLTAYLLQGLHLKTCIKRDWCFTCEFESLIRKAKDGHSPISPIGIISQLQNIGSHLSNGREEDAHEFLRHVVDTMQSICMKEAQKKVADTAEEETTFVGLTFGGYLQSKIRCMKCGSKSERHERMMDLSVEIEGSIGSLEDALKQFTSTEMLDADNKYNCSRCKSYQKAKKKLTVLEAPNILTIALKRFQRRWTWLHL
uniref:Uncharacterized protein n=1 Tax=Kalanchoe fedtschenkoi TaxID=63787 RepID=A0A7N0V0M4_KALFE